MQPFERLRSLARWGRADDDLLAEVADCLGDLEEDPAGLVVACRRLLAHHRSWGRLWWLCSRVLAAPRPGDAALDALGELSADRTMARLAGALPFPGEGAVALAGWPPAGTRLAGERPDLELVSVLLDPLAPRDDVAAPSSGVHEIDVSELAEVAPTHLVAAPRALGPSQLLADAGTTAALDALPARTLVWALAPVGSVLPEALLAAIAEANADAATALEVIDPQRVDRVLGPRGLDAPDALDQRVDVAVAPELLRPLP